MSASGRILSLQVGRAAPLPWRDGTVPSGIVKHPVDGPVNAGRDGLAGDEQADLTVHGGPDKAICIYPSEHMPHWEKTLGTVLPPGAFGENVTCTGLLEPDVCLGDEFDVGTARVQVSQPRGPCFKLAARWNRRDLPALMARAGISGFYFRVLTPGQIGAGDRLELRERHHDVTIADVMRVTYRDRHDSRAVEQVLAVPELADAWRRMLETISRRASRSAIRAADDV